MSSRRPRAAAASRPSEARLAEVLRVGLGRHGQIGVLPLAPSAYPAPPAYRDVVPPAYRDVVPVDPGGPAYRDARRYQEQGNAPHRRRSDPDALEGTSRRLSHSDEGLHNPLAAGAAAGSYQTTLAAIVGSEDGWDRVSWETGLNLLSDKITAEDYALLTMHLSEFRLVFGDIKADLRRILWDLATSRNAGLSMHRGHVFDDVEVTIMAKSGSVEFKKGEARILYDKEGFRRRTVFVENIKSDDYSEDYRSYDDFTEDYRSYARREPNETEEGTSLLDEAAIVFGTSTLMMALAWLSSFGPDARDFKDGASVLLFMLGMRR